MDLYSKAGILDAMRKTNERYRDTLKALADTPDPTAWVEEAATRATVEAEIVAWLRREADAYRQHGLGVWGAAYSRAAGEVTRGEHRTSAGRAEGQEG